MRGSLGLCAILVGAVLGGWGCSASLAKGVEAASFQPKRAAQSAPYTLVPLPDGSLQVITEKGRFFSFSLLAWGPNWSWAGWEGGETAANGLKGRFALSTGAKVSVSLSLTPGGRSLTITTTSDKDTDLTLLCLGASPDGMTDPVLFVDKKPINGPLGIRDFGSQVRELVWNGKGQSVSLAFAQPTRVTSDGAPRIVLAENRLKAGEVKTFKATLRFPGQASFLDASRSSGGGQEGWFAFEPEKAGQGPDELSMASWLDGPAGKKGRITSQGADLLYGGQKIKLWGLNLCYSDCAPPKELAEKRAAFYARNGINAVRLHKYADGPGWAGIQGPGSFASFDSQALDRMDYFVAKLKEKGIYVKLSPTFGVKLGPADAQSVPYLSEFGAAPRPGERVETKHGAVYLGKEIADLQIKQTTALLRHRNPYTGLTYAEDPAIAIVEAYNEDSALFYGTMERLQNVPTLRRRAGAAFAAWLKAKHKTKAGLNQAWGGDLLNTFQGERFTDESWEKGVIYPAGNPWFFDPDQLKGSQAARAKRLKDTMLWLYEQQNAFYSRWKEAVRAAGYSGEVLASNWIAGSGFSHYYNLHSDSLIGMVDRHNYFGGGSGQVIDDSMMVSRPGGGLLSSGLNQVGNRPFSLSEWIHVWPNEWGVEGPAILGSYGMGLQGWDVSFIFQNRDDGSFTSHLGRDQWDATAPQVMGIFPMVARQVLRGDVAEAPIQYRRRVHVPSLAKGLLSADDRMAATGDIKEAQGESLPVDTLAMGRTVVEFTPTFQASDRLSQKPGSSLPSATGQLNWTRGEGSKGGFFTVDTERTVASVGVGGKLAGKNAQIEGPAGFAAIYITAAGRGESLASGKKVLITALARARNTGMTVVGPLLLKRGEPPILLEPVKARVRIPGITTAKVHILDHSGRRTGRTFEVKNGWIEVDTGRDKSPYLLVERP